MMSDAVNRLLLSWVLLVAAWPIHEVAADHGWRSLMGLALIARVAALLLGLTSMRRLANRTGG